MCAGACAAFSPEGRRATGTSATVVTQRGDEDTLHGRRETHGTDIGGINTLSHQESRARPPAAPGGYGGLQSGVLRLSPHTGGATISPTPVRQATPRCGQNQHLSPEVYCAWGGDVRPQ